MKSRLGPRGLRAAIVFSAAAIALAAIAGTAGVAGAEQTLSLTKGQYFTLYLQAEVERVTVGDPQVLTTQVISPQKIRLLGLEYGVTNVLVDYVEGGTDNFSVMVAIDVAPLRGQLQRLMPNERDIRVRANLGTIIMEGEVSTRVAMETAIDVARPFAGLKEASVHRVAEDVAKPERLTEEPESFDPSETPETTSSQSSTRTGGGRNRVPGDRGREPGQKVPDADLVPDIINLMTIAESQQVLLQVQIAEVSTRILKEMGVNFDIIDKNANTAVSTFVGGVVTPGGFTLPVGGRGPISAISTAAGTPEARILHSGDTLSFAAIIDLLHENGLARVLAEPNLIARSGQEASFLAGGEFPIPIVQNISSGGTSSSGGAITVQFKEFGVRLNFVPTVLGNEEISLTVRPEVSDLDFANGVVLSGFRIPGLTVRRATTTVDLRSGQSYAIAGLLDSRIRETVSEIPGLGDIPILGPLFRSSAFEKRETELLILVTPRLIRPLDPEEVPVLPTADYVEPTDYDFYLWGRLEGRGPGEEESPLALRRDRKAGGLVGAWGHYN
ncbi:MAG: type II and III secretion system protein family protein [Deltaproteobacteria bacterium]|nr:type II and III secretion system protein family protein [Deltaproteobacteria bacterium]